MKKVLLKIGGMTCSACSSGLEKYLNKQDGIESASVNLVMNNANIQYDEKKLDLNKIENFIKKAGFESLGIDNFEKEEKKKNNQKYYLILLTILAAITLYISMGHMIGLPSIPFIDPSIYPVNYAIVLLVLSLIVCFMGRDILKNGYKNLIHKTPNMDTLVGLGVLSSILYSIYGTYMIINGHHEYTHTLYYESAVIILFFIKIGKYVENRNKDKTKEAIQELMMITPKHATVLKDGKEKQVTIDEISRGDIVICKPGEKIAVDGIVIEGITHIDESFITGESNPVKKEKGKNVIAGSINYEGTIKYEAKKIGKNSTVSEIVKLVVDATSTKAPIAKIADKISGYFVPAIMIIALVSGIIWFMIEKDFSFAINTFISVLVVACPCSLGLATPLAIVVASGEASRKGILIKNSESLENAHKVKTIVFDKTGTLTKGKLSIAKVNNYSKLPENEIIKIVSSIEAKSEHPIAKGVVMYAKEKGISLENVTDFKNIVGYGVSAKYEEKNYFVGNEKLLRENNILPKSDDEKKMQDDGNSILYLADDKEVLALIGVKDVIKENAKEVINKLNKKNINVVMLTGDNLRTAKVIAKSLNIDKVIANVLPKSKAQEIEKLKNDGLVMMCGDGINDSISLVKADIGVSVESGTDIAMDSSDVVLMKDDLTKINSLIEISQKTVRNIKQNLFWAFFYNICMLPVAVGLFTPFGITINPMMAALAMTISSVTVTLNSLRLKRIIKNV
mgnify:CR=1 FL=1